MFISNSEYTRMKKAAQKKAEKWQFKQSNKVNVGLRELMPEEYDKYDATTPPPHPYPHYQDIYTNYSYRLYSRSKSCLPLK